MKKIYISGKMTGLKDYGFNNFIKAEEYLIKNYSNLDIEIVNPIYISKNIKELVNKELNEIDRKVFLKEDIKQLVDCDVIALLPNYKDSEGALLERLIAIKLGIDVIYLNNIICE